ncbi:hypothetical protein [uncultured Pseudoteredinibacter sp.]|uniref:hypothetical protein n=1 Tax=uncultured Pseudoteredinibacter sp. TaxID=1641701 RepID=UPI0026280E25|nr:hypothetical protein [uncultured Pseudoteredinibacter sp.]
MTRIAIIICLIFITGCASTSSIPLLQKYGSLPEGYGIVAVATGRNEVSGISFSNLSFVSYHVMKKNPVGELERVKFLPAEPGAPKYPLGNLGKGKYGFLHIFEMPIGEYFLIGQEGRGSSVVVAGGGAFGVFDEGLSATGIAFKFDVKPAQVNYLGEILNVDDNLVTSSMQLSNLLTRDKATALKMSKELSGIPFEFTPVKPLTRSAM